MEQKYSRSIYKHTKWYQTWWMNIIFWFFALLLLFSVVNMLVRLRYAYRRLQSVREEQAKTVEQHEKLNQKIADIQSPERLEYYLREQYRAVVPGETVVILLDDTSTSTAEISSNTSKGLIDRLLDFFKQVI